MINLLPDVNKKELRAARTNVVLLRYNILTLITVAVLLLIIGGFYAYLAATKITAEASYAESQEKASAFSDTKKQADEYRSNLATAKQILDNRVNYTSVVLGITELLPKGVVLDSITLTQQDFGNQTTISTSAANYDAITQLKKNFETSDIFSNVHFQSITQSEDPVDEKHPINVLISVKINEVEK